MNLSPVGNRILAQEIASENAIKGVLLPDSAKKKNEWLKIVSIGTSVDSTVFHIGDEILVEKYSGQTIEIEHEEYVILRADNIIAIKI